MRDNTEQVAQGRRCACFQTFPAFAVRRSVAASLLAPLLIAAPQLVWAASGWDWNLNASAELSYDDNWDLDVNDAVDGYRFRLTPDVFVRWETDRALVEADVGVRLDRYFDLSDDEGRIDRQDPFAGLRGRYLLPRGSIGGNAYYSEEALVDQFFQDGTVVNQRGSSTTLGLTGFWTHELSETYAVELAGGYQDVSYSNDTLTDYYDYTAALTLRKAVSERTAAFISANAGFYRPDDGQGDVQDQDAYYLQAGVSHALSPNWSGTVSAGYGRIERDLDDDTVNGWLGQVGLSYSGETYLVGFGVSRDLSGSGGGGLAVTDRVYLDASRQFTDRWEGGVSAFWAEEETPFDDAVAVGTGADSRRYEISPRVSYVLSPDWRLGARYRYRWLRENDAPSGDAADSNAFFLTVTYVPERP